MWIDLVSETVNRSRDATAEVNEFLRVAARDANDGSFAEKAAEYCDVADRLARHRNDAHGCGLAVDHADGALVGDDAEDGLYGSIPWNRDHIETDRAYARHSLELLD